ncbi:MAG: hypothetical protein KC457_24495 [Myxococcales bacterium]|nr:hypothetical protein [Myxococcales bacterium]
MPALARRAGPTGPLAPWRILAPLLYAWIVPGLFLGLAAGELIGSGYPVGFINHHWELVLTASLAGLGTAWLVGVAIEHRPERSWALVPGAMALLAAIIGPQLREPWRLATEPRVNERELAALQAGFAALPEHDLLVVAPRLQEPMAGAERRGDPIEIWFPAGAYAHAMLQAGREPAPVYPLDALPPLRPGERVLLYVGASLRSFQTGEIEAGLVPDSLERPALLELRERWRLEPAMLFEIETPQHEAIITRLGADRRSSIELGYYWLRALEP